MPASPQTEEYLRDPKSDRGDGFLAGDYSLGLFHHDASESSIELLRHPEFCDAAAGSLLCLFECASPDGCVHRIELPHKTRDGEPAKPVIAQYAVRVVEALGSERLDDSHGVLRDHGLGGQNAVRVVEALGAEGLEWAERLDDSH